MIKLKEVYKDYEEKLSKIKLAIFDCDGILTDGRVYYQSDEMGFNRFFHVADGYGMRVLMKAGLHVAIISGGDSKGLRKRLENLKINDIFLGQEDKREAYIALIEKFNLKDEEVLYMGDDLFDIPILKKVGFSATVNHASDEVKDVVDYLCSRPGGHGAAREVIDLLRYSQEIYPDVKDF